MALYHDALRLINLPILFCGAWDLKRLKVGSFAWTQALRRLERVSSRSNRARGAWRPLDIKVAGRILVTVAYCTARIRPTLVLG